MSIFKPKYQTNPTNVNQQLVTDIYKPQAQAGVGATNFLSSLLTGTGDTAAANAGYQNYLDMAGYEPAMRELSQGITGNAAARGLLRSGSTAKALTKYGTELNQQFYNNYLQNLGSLAGIGNQAGDLLVGAGSGESKERPRTAGMIASGIGKVLGIFSDRRLKEDIEKVGEFTDGLGVYEFRYKDGTERFRGVMADEVEKLRPWALGPVVDGYATVIYEAL
jgi:hypothetical protein